MIQNQFGMMTNPVMEEQLTRGYDWFGLVTNHASFEQGDIFDNFPILTTTPEILTGSSHLDDTPLEYHKVILMTHSCDLVDMNDREYILLCDLWEFTSLYKDIQGVNRKKDKWKSLIAGRVVHSHILGKCEIENHLSDYLVVSLSTIFTVPFIVLKEFARKQESRIRLLPPYREHLSQAFARQFMRIGLPVDLPKEYPYSE